MWRTVLINVASSPCRNENGTRLEKGKRREEQQDSGSTAVIKCFFYDVDVQSPDIKANSFGLHRNNNYLI